MKRLPMRLSETLQMFYSKMDLLTDPVNILPLAINVWTDSVHIVVGTQQIRITVISVGLSCEYTSKTTSQTFSIQQNMFPGSENVTNPKRMCNNRSNSKEGGSEFADSKNEAQETLRSQGTPDAHREAKDPKLPRTQGSHASQIPRV